MLRQDIHFLDQLGLWNQSFEDPPALGQGDGAQIEAIAREHIENQVAARPGLFRTLQTCADAQSGLEQLKPGTTLAVENHNLAIQQEVFSRQGQQGGEQFLEVPVQRLQVSREEPDFA